MCPKDSVNGAKSRSSEVSKHLFRESSVELRVISSRVKGAKLRVRFGATVNVRITDRLFFTLRQSTTNLQIYSRSRQLH
jgi:hypothetical protein